MHIEFSEFSHPEDSDTGLESTSILYNFAVAHTCLSRVKGNTTASPPNLKKAHSFFSTWRTPSCAI
jgi:hypothetical protein